MPGPMEIVLQSTEAMLALGADLAKSLPKGGPFAAVLLDGPLGAGKTTLVRGLVQALPGADQARVSSPSFNLVNIYPTDPRVAHFDLYRLRQDLGLDDELQETLEDETILRLVEWAGHLPRRDWPEEFLLISISPEGEERRKATLTACGAESEVLLERLGRQYNTS